MSEWQDARRNKARVMAMRQAWAQIAAGYDAGLAIPDVLSILIKAGWAPPTFASLCANLTRLIEEDAPWLATECGYGWVTGPEAYDYPAEALNQLRFLNFIAAFGNQENFDRRSLGNIAVRQTTNWRRDRPRAIANSVGGWKFIIMPFGWDNFSTLATRAFVAFCKTNALCQDLLGAAEPGLWQPLVKGLFVNAAGRTSQPVIVDSLLSEAGRLALSAHTYQGTVCEQYSQRLRGCIWLLSIEIWCLAVIKRDFGLGFYKFFII